MLREFFPSSDKGASLYSGFLRHQNCFCKIFDSKETIEDTISDINQFLEKNGYDSVQWNEFDETDTYRNEPVTIAPHGYTNQFVLYIERDVIAKTQSDFLINELIKFRNERDWEQFHNSKDLAIALNIETSELLELFLWKNAEDANKEKVKEELADVLAYAFLLAEIYNLSIEEIILDKIKQNAEKYPVDKAKGTAKKYDEL